jgi:hypothetical protein
MPATHSTAALGAFGSEPEHAAESAIDVVHEGYREVAGRSLEVSLVEGDHGGDVDD